MGDENDLDLDQVLDGDETDEDGEEYDSTADDGDEGSGSDQADDPKDKRINELMSKWQKAEARAKKAEAAAKKQQDASSEAPANGQEWLELVREQARGQIFASDPRFAEAGLDASFIEGDTPAAMQASAKRIGELIDSLSDGIRTDVMRKHGLSPEARSTEPAGKAKSVGSMSDEELERLIEKAKLG